MIVDFDTFLWMKKYLGHILPENPFKNSCNGEGGLGEHHN